MGLLNWFKALASGKDDDASDSEDGEVAVGTADDDADSGKIAGLDFKSAIDAHMAWKVRLEKCMAGHDDQNLKVDDASRDDHCTLGKWIYGTGGDQFGHLREFQELKMEHMRFHLAAGDVLSCCLTGDKEGASDKLKMGDYPRASARVKQHLSKLYVKLTDEAIGN